MNIAQNNNSRQSIFDCDIREYIMRDHTDEQIEEDLNEICQMFETSLVNTDEEEGDNLFIRIQESKKEGDKGIKKVN